MKLGPRTPNIKTRVSARTTGAINRKVKRATSPYYGQKGAGLVKDPERAAYNKVYNQTTFSAEDAESCGYGCGCLIFIVLAIVIYFNIF